ncbi:energy transducer TonB [Bacillus sp. NP157]|nr:energy transducer TonB [Bacillus sp. NP157]
MKKQWIIGMAALAMTGLAVAAGPGAARKRAEASMLVTGDITVAPDGSVSGYTLDRQEKLPADVVGLVSKATAKWKFQPTLRDGHAVAAKAHMSLRLVARREAPDSTTYTMRISGASFGDEGAGGEEISYATRTPPAYPTNAIAQGIEGTVYLLVKVGRDGKVADVDAQQVNLGVVGSDTQMNVWRNVLANPAIRVAKTWTFTVPTRGDHASDPYYYAVVPITYHLNRNARPDDAYGTWQAYVPGPKQEIPWAKETGDSADAVPDDGLFLVNSGLKLATPLDNG